MKTSHIVGLSVFAGIAVLVIGIYYLFGVMVEFFEETYIEAQEYAQNATKDDCLEKYVEDYKACDGVACFTKTATFGVMCLAEAQGDLEEFCSDKPMSEDEVMDSQWNRNFCKPRGLNEYDCKNVYSIVEAVCSPDA
jgi:hypothetical protein